MDDFDNAFNSLGTLMVGPVARTVVVVVVLVVRVVVVVVGSASITSLMTPIFMAK